MTDGDLKYYMNVEWNEDKLDALLRFGRKQIGPWDDIIGDMPTDGDEKFICYAPKLVAEIFRLRNLLEDISGDSAFSGFSETLKDRIYSEIEGRTG